MTWVCVAYTLYSLLKFLWQRHADSQWIPYGCGDNYWRIDRLQKQIDKLVKEDEEQYD